MTRGRLPAYVVLMGLALLGCHAEGPARADAPELDLNEPFILAGGQEGLIGAEDLRLRFAEVLEDSRCPAQVECFWTGQARLTVKVAPPGSPATNLTFNTNPAPGQTVKVGTAGAHSVELESLDPYPETPDDPIPFEDYRATLVVRKS